MEEGGEKEILKLANSAYGKKGRGSVLFISIEEEGKGGRRTPLKKEKGREGTDITLLPSRKGKKGRCRRKL